MSWEEWQRQKSAPASPQKREYTVDDIPELVKEVKRYEEWLIFGGDYDSSKGREAIEELKRLRESQKQEEPNWSKIPDFKRMTAPEIDKWIASNVYTPFGPTKNASKDYISETVKAVRLVEERIGGPIPGVDLVKFGLGNKGRYEAADYNERTKILSVPSRPKLGLKKHEEKTKKWAYETDPPEVATTTVLGTTLHEIGHAVDISSGRKLGKMFFNGAEPRNKNSEKILSISRYASSLSRLGGREEAVAEVFSAWLDPNKERTRYVPAEVGKAIDRFLKDLKPSNSEISGAGWKNRNKKSAEREDSTRRINKDTTIDRNYIASKEYRQKFEKIDPDPKVSRMLVYEARELLNLFQGTEQEGMAYVDPKTGQVLVNHQEKSRKSVTATHKMREMVEANPNQIIGIHNHPGSSSPSGVDIVGLVNRKYKYGLVCCHDGTVYKYSVSDYDEAKRHDSIRFEFTMREFDKIDKSIPEKERSSLEKKICDKVQMMGVKIEVY